MQQTYIEHITVLMPLKKLERLAIKNRAINNFLRGFLLFLLLGGKLEHIFVSIAVFIGILF